MSDNPSPDYITDVIAKDQRFAAVAAALALEQDLRESVAIKTLLSAVRDDAERAFDELGRANPGDTTVMADLLVRIRTLFYIRDRLNAVIRRGQSAEQAIRSDDEMREREESGMTEDHQR